MTDLYVVIGNPIEHSKSPDIHAEFARETGQDISYDRLLGDLDDFNGSVVGFIKQGGKGLNVTVPFKEKAFALATKLSPRAQVAKAVNTLIVEADGSITGDNTDGAGLVRDLTQNHQCDLAGKNILLLGAGGASKGVLLPLLEQQPASLTIANRTAAKAVALAELYKKEFNISGIGLDQLADIQFDVVINGTAAGLSGDVPVLPEQLFTENAVAYDMMYGDKPTAFCVWAMQHGATQVFDGLGMLVEQAAESFYLWRNVRPSTANVIAKLKKT